MGVKGEGNRQRIIDAATELFYHKGYHQTSFSDIAAASGLSRGNFYYYFKTKEEILGAVIAQRTTAIRRMLDEWTHQSGGPRERINRYLGSLGDSQEDIARYGCPIGSLNTELAKSQCDLQTEARALFELYRDWLEVQFAELGQPARSRALALHTMALVQGASVLCNVYADAGYLQQELAQIQAWTESIC